MIYHPTIAYNYRSQLLRELVTYIFPLAFLFGTMYYPNNKVDKILIVVLLYSIVGSLGLLYGLAHDPNWHLGERAGIKFEANVENSNPHAFANNALYGILSALIIANQTKKILLEIFCYIATFFCLIILILCRTNTSIVCLGVFLAIYCCLNFKTIIKNSFKARTLLFVSPLIVVIWIGIRQFPLVSSIIFSYAEALSMRLVNLVYTVSGRSISKNQIVEIDESSVNRIFSYRYVVKMFEDGKWTDILVGEGYKSQFLDIPILEALTNHGILGFLLFSLLFIFIIITSLLQIIRPANGFSLFLGYFSIVILLTAASGSRPVDLGMWLVYIVYIRFMGADYNNNEVQLNEHIQS
jgi:hypothetical protein